MAERSSTLRAPSQPEGHPLPDSSVLQGTRTLLLRAKRIVERTFGIKISRAQPAASTGYADPAISRLRRWASSDVVFDVGANDGRTILRIRDLLNHPRIHAFEPVAATFQTLVSRTAGMPGVVPHHLALGSRSGRTQIYVSHIPAMSSLSPDWTSPAAVEEVELSTIDAVMAAQGLERIHFLKIDTEGSELDVLEGAEGALRDGRVSMVQLEVGFDQMQSRRFVPLEEARQYLAARGYVLYGIYNQCRTKGQVPASWPAAERAAFDARVLVYCDALFIRADLIS